MDLGAAADGIALVSLAGKSLASLAVAIICAGLAAMGWFSRKKWYLLACLVLLLANLVYLASVISDTGQVPVFASVLGTNLAMGVVAMIGLGRCRPRIQFRLRTLSIAVLVLSVPLQWFAMRMQRARMQREAIVAIKRLGGTAYYEWEFKSGGTKPSSTWWRNVLGHDYFDKVVLVRFANAQIGDTDLEHVKNLPDLESLFLGDTEVSDAGLEYLERLTSLEYIELTNTHITDAGMPHLTGLSKLSVLVLNGTQVTDAGLESLKQLTNMECLRLEGTHVTDAWLEHPAGLTDLEDLGLGNTQITDAGLAYLKKLTKLRSLSLTGTPITEAGLVNLKELPDLRKLLLAGPLVTDAWLEQLKTLAKLEYLYLKDTKVTEAGINELKKALPNVEITSFSLGSQL